MGSACSSPKVDDNLLITDKNVYTRMCWSTCIDYSAGLLFEVKAAADAKVGLFTNESLESPFVELVLGSKDNTCTTVQATNTVKHAETAETLDEDHFRTFWITWVDGKVCIGRGCIPAVAELATFTTPSATYTIHVVKVTTCSGTGVWRNPRLIDRTHLEGIGHPDQYYNPPILKADQQTAQAQVHSSNRSNVNDAAHVNDPGLLRTGSIELQVDVTPHI